MSCIRNVLFREDVTFMLTGLPEKLPQRKLLTWPAGRSRRIFGLIHYEKKRGIFGVVVFESDQDLDPQAAYLCYDDR